MYGDFIDYFFNINYAIKWGFFFNSIFFFRILFLCQKFCIESSKKIVRNTLYLSLYLSEILLQTYHNCELFGIFFNPLIVALDIFTDKLPVVSGSTVKGLNCLFVNAKSNKHILNHESYLTLRQSNVYLCDTNHHFPLLSFE